MQQGMRLSETFANRNNDSLSALIMAVTEGAKVLSKVVRNASLLNLTGAMNTTNVQGEAVQKLDDFSNKVMMDYCLASTVCAGYLSEENEAIETLSPDGKYIIAVDPLDGSSNIDVAAPIGTIFSVFERVSAFGENVTTADFLQSGKKTIAAGFILYGSGTMLVLSTGNGTDIFTLDADDNEFKLTKENVKIPEFGAIYSINQGAITKFEVAAQQFVAYCTSTDKAVGTPFSLRYIGSMVGDMYRTFLKGGIFLYPADSEGKGKLRILYECFPMAFLTEQAGGKATDGKHDILSITPVNVHERVPIVIGSAAMVEKYSTFK